MGNWGWCFSFSWTLWLKELLCDSVSVYLLENFKWNQHPFHSQHHHFMHFRSLLFFTINGGISFHYKTCCTLDKSNALSCAFETSSPIMSKLEIKGSVIYITWCGLYFEPPVDKKLAWYKIPTLQMNIQKCFVQKEKKSKIRILIILSNVLRLFHRKNWRKTIKWRLQLVANAPAKI